MKYVCCLPIYARLVISCVISNAWYRLKPKVTVDPKTHLPVVQFRHPASPGNTEGGWMEPPARRKGERGNEGKDLKSFSLEEIGKHRSEVPTFGSECLLYACLPMVRTMHGLSSRAKCMM